MNEPTRAAGAGGPYGPRELAVRMLIPMRREFRHELDVTRMVRDARYARSVALSALSSDCARLRGYGRLLAARLPPPQRPIGS
jgi:hypothetical protein